MNKLTEQEFDKIALKCQNITDFLEIYFPHHYSKPFATFHREIFETLRKYPRCAIAAPRKHGKSEIVSFGYVMWNLLWNPDNRLTIIISNNYANSVKYLTPIKEEIEYNPLIRLTHGDLKSDKWSENEIEFSHKKKIIVGGNDFKIRGQKYLQYRPDLIIIDDAEDDELVRSDARRENFEKWLLYSLEPAMTAEKNQIVVIGTILHRASQLSKLMMGEGKYKEWETRKYQAITDNSALWEDNIPLEWLKQEEQKDPYKFAQEYMNNPVPYEHAMFKEEYFDNYADEQLPKNLIINITCDLACTDKSYSDYTVILPCGVDEVGDLWILPYTRGKYVDPDKIIEELFKSYEKYNKGTWKVGRVGVEKNSFQRFLIKNFQRERKKRGLHFPVFEIQAKGDKTQRIAQLQPLFASGDLHIRYDMLDLKQELLDFPRSLHDDIADALTMQMEFLDRKPLVKTQVFEKWKVTPEKQFKKELKRRSLLTRPKIKNIAVGV